MATDEQAVYYEDATDPPPARSSVNRGAVDGSSITRRRPRTSRPSPASSRLLTRPKAAPAAPDPREARRKAGRLAALLGISTTLVYLVIGVGLVLFLTQHRWNNPDVAPRFTTGPFTSITAVLALTASLTVALHVGVYNLEKDKTSDRDRGNPVVHLRYRVFEAGAFICVLIAAAAGLLAVSAGPHRPTFAGGMQAAASVVIVLLGQLVVFMRPEEFAADPAADADDRRAWARPAASYWSRQGTRLSLTKRAAYWRVVGLVLVLPLVVRLAGTHLLGGSWGVALIPWLYWAFSVWIALGLWKEYLQRAWPIVVIYSVGLLGTGLTFVVSALYDAVVSEHRNLTFATWVLVASITSALAYRSLRIPNQSRDDATAPTRQNRALASLSYRWLSDVIGVEKPGKPASARKGGWFRWVMRRLSVWNANATGRVAEVTSVDAG